MPEVLVPPARWARWLTNFETGHGETVVAVDAHGLRGEAVDGSTFAAALPFDTAYAGGPDPCDLVRAATAPHDWGVLLVRKGGFAVARMSGDRMVAHKIGQRHVQGRTKAGGQSQQRFARRRDNQARQAFEAAADHAARLLSGGSDLPVVVGGDRDAVDQVLADPTLRSLRAVGPWLAVPDPKRAVLDRAVLDARALIVRVHNAE